MQLKTGKTIQQIAKEYNIEYWPLVKNLYIDPKRINKPVRQRIAEILGASCDDLFGPQSKEKVEELIKQEISRVTVDFAMKYQQRLLKKAIG
jgi:hypothetical protein